jgi:hypothetical protein
MGRFVEIKGWALVPEEEIRSLDSHYVLKRESDGKYFLISTAPMSRQDVKDTFSGGQAEGTDYGYDRAGLWGKVKATNLDLENDSYSLYIAYGNNGHNILKDTGVVINAGTV